MKRKIFTILFVILTFLGVLSFCLKLDNLLFVISLSAMACVLFTAKISAFSVISLFITYMLFPVFVQENFGHSYGALQRAQVLYASEIYFAILLFNLTIFGICIFTDVLKGEKKLYKVDFPYNPIFCYICSAIAVVFSIIKFPSFGGERFNSLLPGESWNHLVLAALIFLTFYMRKSHVAKVAFCFSICWFLLHGERVDMLGYLIFLVLFCFHKYDIKITPKNFAFLIGSGLTAFFALIIVGDLRTGSTISVESLIESLLIQPTAADIAYVFNSSIHFAKTESLYMGYTYLVNLLGIIPLVDTPNRPEILLAKMYNAPGGEFYFSESVMNYGYFVGIIVSLLMFIVLVTILIKYQSKNIYIRLCALFIISALPRLIWYGKHYAISGLTIFIPMLIIFRFVSMECMERVEVLCDE